MTECRRAWVVFCLLVPGVFLVSALGAPARAESSNLIHQAALWAAVGNETPTHAQGEAAPTASLEPWGETIGTTWWENQRNGSMRRMIAWGMHGSPDTLLVHFGWMRMPAPVFGQRKYYYRCWNAITGIFDCGTGIQPDDEYAGYVVVDVTNDNRAIVGGHNVVNPSGPYQSHFYWDFAPGTCFFATNNRVPDTLGDDCQVTDGDPSEDGFVWPAMCWQEGTDTILHVFALEDNHSNDHATPGSNQPKAVAYFRAVYVSGSLIWDAPVYCIDTVYTFGHDCDCSDEGKVAIAWISNREAPPPVDPASVEFDNDLYYQISNDGGETWLPRVNVTNNVGGQPGFRPYTDLSVLLDSQSRLHLVWNTRVWLNVPDPTIRGGVIFHWSENHPFIEEVHSYGWVPGGCNGGAWNLNACKMTVSECDGKLYCLFVQYNPTDCADPGNPDYPYGAANGDLYLTISADYGVNWDNARNLTNTHTLGCDSVGGAGGPCESEVYPSMVKFGTDYPGAFPDNTLDPSIPPDSPYTGNWFLDVQYVNDPSAGCIVQNEGYWQEADMKWFRLPCVEPGDATSGACCDVNDYCFVTTEADCQAFGGTYKGDGSTCASTFSNPPNPCCCHGTRGNIDGDPQDQINVADLTYIVDYLFRGGSPPPCSEESDVTGVGSISIASLTYLVDFLFRAGPPPPSCPLP